MYEYEITSKPPGEIATSSPLKVSRIIAKSEGQRVKKPNNDFLTDNFRIGPFKNF